MASLSKRRKVLRNCMESGTWKEQLVQEKDPEGADRAQTIIQAKSLWQSWKKLSLGGQFGTCVEGRWKRMYGEGVD